MNRKRGALAKHVGAPDQEWLYNFGTRYPLAENLNFMGSAGRTFKAYLDSAPAWNLYAGVQIRL